MWKNFRTFVLSKNKGIMKIKRLITSEKGNLVADVGNGKYVAKANTMELAICKRVRGGFLVLETVMAGFMLREHGDFVNAVKALKI